MNQQHKPQPSIEEKAVLLRRAFEDMKNPVFLESRRWIAEERFMMFKAYIAAGFDAEQALRLVIGRVA